MEKKKHKNSKKLAVLIFSIAFLFLSVFIFIELIISSAEDSSSKYNEDDIRSFHVVVTGTYENQHFMQEVYEGALKQADFHSAIVELYVPESQASNTSLQDLLDYCVYVNADGIIAFIDSPEEQIGKLQRSEGNEIPLITTGQFSTAVHQISFIGSGYWELGKKVADETLSYINNNGHVYVINDNDFLSTNSNYNNLITSMQTSLISYPEIQIEVLTSLNENFSFPSENTLFVCLTEDSTIHTAQYLRETFPNENYNLIGFGSNEACQIYLQKKLISELISLDPEKIGESAITELFEYRNKGYANSYISADVKISKAEELK